MVLDENFTHAVATPLVSTLADGSRFSSRQGEYYKQKRTVFDRSVFSPCNCDYDEGESPIWDLRATKSEHNTKTQTIIHSNVRMNIFGLPFLFSSAGAPGCDCQKTLRLSNAILKFQMIMG